MLRFSLEDCLRAASGNLRTRKARTFKVKLHELQCVKLTPKKGILLFDVTKTFPDQSTATVAKADNLSDSVDVDEERPPAAHDFLDGEVFMLVAGDNLLTISNAGATEYTAFDFIRMMMNYGRAPAGGDELAFEKVADVDKFKILSSEGAKSVQLNLSLSEAEVLFAQQGLVRGPSLYSAAAEFGSFIKSQFRRAFSDGGGGQEARGNLTMTLQLSFAKNRKGADAASYVVTNLAGATMNEQQEGFKIVTGSGKSLTYDEVRLHKKVHLQPHGNSVQRHDAFLHLQDYYHELRAMNAIP